MGAKEGLPMVLRMVPGQFDSHVDSQSSPVAMAGLHRGAKGAVMTFSSDDSGGAHRYVIYTIYIAWVGNARRGREVHTNLILRGGIPII